MRRQLLAGGAAEHPLDRPPGVLRQLSDRGDAARRKPRAGDRPDAPHQVDRQIMQEGDLAGGVDHHQPVGLGDLGGDLCQMLGARDADRDRQADLRRAPGAGSRRDLGRRSEQMRAPGDVRERLIDRNPLDQRREVAQHLDGGVAQPPVLLEMAIDEDAIAGKARAPAVPACRCGPRRPWPRRRPPARLRRRPRSACRAAMDRATARPRRRRHRGPHAGWWPSFPSATLGAVT